MSSIHPESHQLEALQKKIPAGKAFVMLNMLRFKPKADYPEGCEAAVQDISGRDAYGLYGEVAAKLVAKVGGGPVWFGEAMASVIAPADEHWDQIFLMQYPSIEKFMEMVDSQEYKDVVVHRTAALADSRLIATLALGGK